MHENKFEKEVREKMDHFGLDPSEAVWAGVEKEIDKNKKDRRPLFWLFFFSGLALLGGGIYFAGNKYSADRNLITLEKQGVEKNHEKQSEVDASNKPESLKLNDPGKVPGNVSSGQTTNRPKHKDGHVSKNSLKKEVILKSGNYTHVPENALEIKTGESKQPEEKKTEAGSIGQTENNGKIITGSAPATAEVAKEKTSPTDSVSDGKVTGKENKAAKKLSWTIGFSGNAGVSNVNQTLYKPTVTTTYSLAPLSSGPGTVSATTTRTSEIDQGFSFAAGVFANRDLSNRLSFRAGLGYHYFSIKINTGKAVNGPVYTFSNNTQGLIANSFYQNGNDREYTNKYYFIDLPVAINFQLNKSIHSPLIWQTGLSLSYLVNSNALYFDPLSNVYFENSQQFNRAQLNATTALLIGFNMHHCVFQVGPLLQYGLTGLSKNGAGNPEHLIYYGVGISLIPGKK
jgi:Outer membrane protein beta-barrel domain